MCLHPSVSLNNEKICREFSEHKIAVCEKTAGLRSGNSSDLNSACLKVLVPVEISQFSDMHYGTERYRDSTDGLVLRSVFRYICGNIIFTHLNSCSKKRVRNFLILSRSSVIAISLTIIKYLRFF